MVLFVFFVFPVLLKQARSFMKAIHLIKNKNLIYEQRLLTFINEVQAGIITIRCFKKEAQLSEEFR